MFKEAARMLMPNSKMGYDLPANHWFQYVKESTRYTPDVAVLEQFEYQLFFACDETKRGHIKHDLLDGKYLCPGFSQQSFNFWLPEEPWVPCIPMEAKGYLNSLKGLPPIAKIKGEVHKIRPQVLLKLDTEKQNGIQFLRQKARIIVPYRALVHVHDKNNLSPEIEFVAENSIGLTKERVCVIRAWMYVGIPDYWDKILSTFDYGSVQTYESKNRRWLSEYYDLRKTRPG